MTRFMVQKSSAIMVSIVLTILLAILNIPILKAQAASLIATTTNLTVDVNPSVYLGPVNFSVSVSPIPDGGTVLFQDNGNDMGSPVVVNSAGWAYYNTAMLSVNNHTITAVYSGDANYASSNSNIITEVVNAGNPPSINMGTPNISELCVSIDGSVAANNPGASIVRVNFDWGDGQTMAGWFPQTHTYSQLGNYTVTILAMDSAGQMSSVSIPVSVSGTATQTTVILTSSVNPSTYSQSVTFVAGVSPIPDGGTILFQDTGNCMGSPVAIDNNGQAIYTVSSLRAGGHTIKASYSGDNNFASSSGTVNQFVNLITGPTISLGTPNVNGPVVTINGNALPTFPGAVVTGIFWDWGDGQWMTGWFPQTHTYVQPGTYSIIVSSEDSNRNYSSTLIKVSVGGSSTQTTTTLTSVSPSIFGQSVTFTASVSPIPDGGTILFQDNSTCNNSPEPVDSNGQAVFTVSALSIGSHHIVTSYSGDNSFASSSATITQVVNTTIAPTISFFTPGISGLFVTVNGVTYPTVPNAGITGIMWDWGDGQTNPGWFPQTHYYSKAGTYIITSTSIDSQIPPQSQSTSTTVKVSGTAPPTVNAPLLANTTSVSGTAEPGSSIVLSINGAPQPAITADATTGIWTVTDLSLSTGYAISITAQMAGQPISSPATATVIAALSTDANLSNLATPQGILSPAFSPSQYNYTENVAFIMGSVVPTWTQNNAIVTVNGTVTTSGAQSNIPLNIGPNTLTFIVTMPTGTEIYTIVVTRVQGQLVTMVVNPGPSSNLTIGATQQFAAVGYYQDNSNTDFTNSAIWVSSDPSIVKITPSGFATCLTEGTAYISATVSGITSSAVALTVGTPQTLSTTSGTPTSNESLAGGVQHNVGVKSDGTVVATGLDNFGQVSGTSAWTNITQVACGQFVTVGLKSDGTVVAAGVNNFGQCDVASWANIVQVAAFGNLVLGLKSNGTVVATGFNNYGQCNVSGWTGIVQIAAEGSTAVGLKYDGTVVATGNNSSGQCNVSSWTGIKQITGAGGFTIGLKSDGTVIAAGSDTYGQCDLSSWSAITQVATGSFNTIGLKSDGTVVAAGPLSGTLNYGQCDVASWKGIIQIGTGYYSTMGLKSDGTVVATGRNDVNYNESTNANSWNLGCRTLTSIQGGGAFVTQNNGIVTSITGANNQAIVCIGSINNGNTPPSVGTVGLNGSQYYDTNVTSNSNLGTGATATITISNSSITADSTIEYWYNNQWNTATNLVINLLSSPPTISGDVLVSYLTGTPFAIGVPTLNSITVIPNPPSALVVGSTEQFTATGAFSDGIQRNITSQVTWSSSDSTKATIASAGGLATGVSIGLTNITAAANGISSSPVALQVIPASTSTLGADATVVYSGSSQTVNLNASVTATGVTVNEGVVKFTVQNGNTVIGKPVTSGTVSGGNAHAIFMLPGGTQAAKYTIIASYSGGADFNASIDSIHKLTVNQAVDQTFVISIPNPSVYGSQVTFTAVVLPSTINPANIITSNNGSSLLNTTSLSTILGNYIPTGSITFMDGTTILGTVKLSKLGFVTFTTSFLTAGNHSIAAKYSGDTNYLSSVSGTLTQKINKANATISLTSAPNPTNSKTTVTFTATLNSTGATGTITFTSGSTVIGTGSVPLVNGKAILKTTLSLGNYSITAVYNGDSNFNGSTSNTVKQIIK